ncbi:hypothetical protein [Calditerrivibrio sp.]|uniref:hypothetical protein n=1 Tax=Calditerrivibrio sp. TaxID=2792612 RepID=UPI003D09651E
MEKKVYNKVILKFLNKYSSGVNATSQLREQKEHLQFSQKRITYKVKENSKS